MDRLRNVFAHMQKRILPLTQKHFTRPQKIFIWTVCIVFCLVCILVWRVHHHGASAKANLEKRNTLPSVVLGTASHEDVPVYRIGLGTVVPLSTVTVKTQINGKLEKIHFTEGKMVEKDALLAEIDGRPYHAQLVQYKGQLARDRALLLTAQNDLKRYKDLFAEDSIAKQTLDTQAGLVKQYEGVVAIDLGLIEGVQVNLNYCYIKSPITGRIGLRLVDVGNFVQTSDAAGLFIINTVQPISVLFTLPEDNIPEIEQQIHQGKILIVEAYDRSQNKLLATGTLLTLDNQIDPATGTIKLKAQFDNQDDALFPNQFVNIRLKIETLPNATVLPTRSIQHGLQGNFVFAFNEDKTVSIKPVSVGATFGDKIVITSGIQVGEKVVVDGTDKLTEGAHVVISELPTISAMQEREGPILR